MVKLFYFDVRMMAEINDNWVVKMRWGWNFFYGAGWQVIAGQSSVPRRFIVRNRPEMTIPDEF